MNCLLILSLAVLGAVSAAPCGVSVSSGCNSALPGRTVYSQTPVLDNPTAVFPSCFPPTSVSEACHCLKTVVRPQIRNEIITVPTIDRIVRVVPSSVVEAVTVNTGGCSRNHQIPTCATCDGCGIAGTCLNGVVGGCGNVAGGCGSIVGGCGSIVGGCGSIVGGCGNIVGGCGVVGGCGGFVGGYGTAGGLAGPGCGCGCGCGC